MTRSEHMQWCKDRALHELAENGPNDAVLSMISDLRKHEETVNHPFLIESSLLLVGGHLSTPAQVKHWIEGFN